MPKPKKPKVTVSDIPKSAKLPPFNKDVIKQIEDLAITKPPRDRLSELRRRMFREDI